ncbi:uncharacterized protein EMH_0021350 [Eimeria mitis]|uniref:Uncharacterized protein n=1 Tax=Eimeria mitis TaxID=44415 RepID=U6K0M9_9EIME|nr:uncharacterized protein EMH_0021350 [Eimeria mitis]CDJ29318.1 hypothetical protein EMH_0021350 [Eimeria mitis]
MDMIVSVLGERQQMSLFHFLIDEIHSSPRSVVLEQSFLIIQILVRLQLLKRVEITAHQTGYRLKNPGPNQRAQHTLPIPMLVTRVFANVPVATDSNPPYPPTYQHNRPRIPRVAAHPVPMLITRMLAKAPIATEDRNPPVPHANQHHRPRLPRVPAVPVPMLIMRALAKVPIATESNPPFLRTHKQHQPRPPRVLAPPIATLLMRVFVKVSIAKDSKSPFPLNHQEHHPRPLRLLQNVGRIVSMPQTNATPHQTSRPTVPYLSAMPLHRIPLPHPLLQTQYRNLLPQAHLRHLQLHRRRPELRF